MRSQTWQHKNLEKKRWHPSPNLGSPNILVDVFILMVNEYHNMVTIRNKIIVKEDHHPSSGSDFRKEQMCTKQLTPR